MSVEILFFASLREIVGGASLRWDLAGEMPVGDLFDRVTENHPQLVPFKASILFAVNETFVSPSHPVRSGDVVAFLPPVSGG